MPDRDPLAAFDDAVLTAVAGGADAERRLREVARRHQETVRANPGVDDLVYEWRRGYSGTELIERTEEAYYLQVEATAWREFGDALDLATDECDRLRTLHARQFAAVGMDGGKRDDRHPMVLTRP